MASRTFIVELSLKPIVREVYENLDETFTNPVVFLIRRLSWPSPSYVPLAVDKVRVVAVRQHAKSLGDSRIGDEPC